MVTESNEEAVRFTDESDDEDLRRVVYVNLITLKL